MRLVKICDHAPSRWSRCEDAWYIEEGAMRLPTGTANRAEAARRLRIMQSGIPAPADGTLGASVDVWLKHSGSSAGLDGPAKRLLRVIPRGTLVADIGVKEIEKAIEALLGEGLSASYTRKAVSVLERALILARESGLVEHVPDMPTVPGLAEAKSAPTVIPPREAVLRALGFLDSEHEAPTRLSLEVGLTPAEILALDWENMESDLSRVVIDSVFRVGQRGVAPSASGTRTVLIPKAARRLLGAHGGSGPVFPKLNYRTWLRHVQRACDRAGVERFGLAVLRHENILQRLRDGEPPASIVGQVGDYGEIHYSS